MKLIDKDALVMEIERRMQEHHSGYLVCLKDILSYLNTIEVKVIDLDKYYIDFLQREWFGKHCNRPMSEMMAFTAKHFFELGLQAKNNQNEWNKVSTKPPFTTTIDGNKYSNPMLCYDKFGNYCIAQYVRWQTGHCGWYDNEEEVSITHWKELKAQKGE